MERQQPGSTLYFFLSYARGDDDLFVQEFFHDLSIEVRALAGLSVDHEVGFFDVHSLEVGATWSPRLMSALANCRSFVALLSPRYLISEPCGKEWTVFADRLRRYAADRGIRPSVLLPLLWLPPRSLPDEVSELQYDNDNLPNVYRRAGMRQLMRLTRYHDNYLELVSELARQIVELADAHELPVPPTAPDFSRVPSAFHRPLANNVEPGTPPGPRSGAGPAPGIPGPRAPRSLASRSESGVPALPGRGTVPQDRTTGAETRQAPAPVPPPARGHTPASGAAPGADPASGADPVAAAVRGPVAASVAGSQYVHFVVAAPSRGELDSAELGKVRRNHDFYGARPEEWAPYRPRLAAPIAEYARSIAEQRSFESGVWDLTGLSACLDSANRNNQIVVLLVDVWSTRLHEHRRVLVEYNERDEEPASAVMVPDSHDDQETQAHWRQLSDELRKIFIRRAGTPDDRLYRPSILTHHAFDADLQVVLEVARNRILRRGQVHREVPGAAVMRPILDGP